MIFWTSNEIYFPWIHARHSLIQMEAGLWTICTWNGDWVCPLHSPYLFLRGDPFLTVFGLWVTGALSGFKSKPPTWNGDCVDSPLGIFPPLKSLQFFLSISSFECFWIICLFFIFISITFFHKIGTDRSRFKLGQLFYLSLPPLSPSLEMDMLNIFCFGHSCFSKSGILCLWFQHSSIDFIRSFDRFLWIFHWIFYLYRAYFKVGISSRFISF